MISTHGYAAHSATTPPAPWSFEHRDLGSHDVLVDIAFCGICHSDIHQARNEWGNAIYPMVPGHEIVGTVARVGAQVTKFRVGDRVGVGTVIDSCRECDSCKAGEEVYCERTGPILTYNGRDKNGNVTFGGYADKIVVDENYVLRIPARLDPAGAAPLLCAGITTYSPLRHWQVGKGKKVGIVGLGGLGHLGLKFAHAFGAHVVQFTTSPGKTETAKALGADEVIVTRDGDWVKKHAGSFDFILDCVSAPHDVTPFLTALRRDSAYCTVGVPAEPLQVHAFSVVGGRKSITGSATGGIKETQEMLDFCGEHNLVADIEMTSYGKLDAAWERVVKGDVRYRFVLDGATL